MAFPTFNEMLEPLLRVLSSAPDGIAAKQAQEQVAIRLGLTDDDKKLRVPSGTQLLFRHRTNWAHDRLKRAGLSACPRRGVWQLTKKGVDLVRKHDAPLTKHELRDLATTGRDVRMVIVARLESATSSRTDEPSMQSPQL